MSLNKQDWIAGLEHGLTVMEAFDREHDRMTIAAVANRTGLSRSAARRYLLTLAHLGYVSTDGKLFALTPRVLRVGWSYFDSARLPKIALPYLQQLSAKIDESCYLSVLDEWELVVIARSGGPRVITTGFVLGARVPAVLTSPGIVLLGATKGSGQLKAWIETQSFPPFTPHTVTLPTPLMQTIIRARATGYALIEQQLQLGVRGLAVPVKNRQGEVVGAISTSMPMGKETGEEAMNRVLSPMQDTALSLMNAV